ncbi:hypothetical protein AN958_00378 [Leucoagaricus sp. SymC.cos]|nr:hypothetical protein AN958_00378 [Leucoagaricus sp. SymC.cos]
MNRTHTLQPIVRLVVSCNGEQYRVVDVTGAPDGSWVRERIYSKLNIPDDSQATFSIFPSEIGSYALGEPLNDRELFSLCRKHGDPSGGLKFFVSTSPDHPPSHYDPGYNSDLSSVCTHTTGLNEALLSVISVLCCNTPFASLLTFQSEEYHKLLLLWFYFICFTSQHRRPSFALHHQERAKV